MRHAALRNEPYFLAYAQFSCENVNCRFDQVLTHLAPVMWGQYHDPPPDIPECGFVGELCPHPTPGQLRSPVLKFVIILNFLFAKR